MDEQRERLAQEHAAHRRAVAFPHHRYDNRPPQPDDYAAADVTLAHLQPRTVSTVEDLNNLKAFAAVLTGVTDTGQRYVWQKDAWNDWRSMLGTYSPERLIQDYGTLTVVFDPESEG